MGRDLSVVGLGCWQLGADWGEVSEADATETVVAALDSGVTFLDTADVYGDGRSERVVGAVASARPDRPFVATKAGRRADPFEPATFTEENLRAWVERSRQNLGVDTLDLVQLHCPPTPVYSDDRVFDVLDALVSEGVLAAYGVSVETCEEALTAIARPGVATVQIILNAFRLKPLDEVLPAAQEAGVGIIARVPLASGLLSGRYDASTTFAEDDHRNYNRDGQAFDVGETFSGVPFDVGLRAVEELKDVAGERPVAELALRWVVDTPGVTSVIPGARNPDQARRNAAVMRTEPLTDDQRAAVRDVYDRHVRALVHDRW
ncbi:aldo/keto reductase [Aquipuribacter sp. SD81]|uniref:aldo/keto reductase n=1 Tax=Aquipuribacter sp. SD81 TaxID=3127703 RepID=UPI0030196D93